MAAVVGLLLLAAITMVTADSQYMAIFPKELRNGMNFQVDMTMFSAPKSTLEVKVAIREQTDLSSALAWDGSQFTISIAAGSKSGSNLIMVPYDVEAGKALYVHITFTNLNLPPKYEKVVVTRPMSAIFIQTDKGIYKPGDTVRYRVLNVDEELKPQQEVLTVKIKDANDNMIMSQKSDGSSGVNLALISNNFTISDDPIKGIYKIIAETATGYTEATFKVEEYVLPKFEVKVTLDRGYAVTGPDARISGKVKAIYSYGQLVKGRMVLKLQSSGSNVFPRGISTSTGSSSPGMKEVIVENFGGEHVFDIPVQESLGEPNWAGGMYSVSLSVIAEVTESNTKNMMSDSKSFTMYPAEFAPTLVEPIPMAFSGHANYSFQVKLTNPMGGQLSDWDKKNRVNSNAVSLYKLYYTVNYQPQQSLPVTDSITNVTVAIEATNQYNTIEVWYQYTTVDRNTILSAKVQVKPILYYSGSQRTISVQLVPTENKNERCFRMTPFMAGDQAFYQVVNNYYPEKVTPYTSIDKHCITMTRAHAPQSMIIVYKLVNYVDENKINTTELLTSSVTVDYAWSTEQSVTLEVVPEQVKPGENVDIVLQTTGAAVVGISGVDKSTTFLAEANDITMSKLQKSIEQYRLFSRPQENPFPNPPMLFRGAPLMLEKRAEPPKRKKRCIACWDEYAYMDPKKLLMEAGLTIITDLNIYQKTDFPTDVNMWMLGAVAPEADGAAMSKGDGNVQQPQPGVVTGTQEQPKEEVKVRQDFPETWLWDLEMTDESGAKQITVAVPDTITSWTLNAFAFNNEHGLGVAETKEVTVFQDFFLSMDLPYSVVRGEVFDLNLLVFNYKDTTITVSVELMASPNYTILDLGKRNQTLTIVPGTSSSAIVPLRMDKIGDIPITASAKQTTNTNNMDYVIRELIVKPEGREIRKDTGFKIAMPQKAETEIFFDISQFFNIEGYVPDSLRMYMYVTGDMMGPFIENLETKIQMPFGCGEQNIKTLTPSVFVAKYLKTINRLDSKMQAKVGKVCGSGYRKELIYKHKDGSYSAFGEEANLCQCGAAGQKRGSTWLTAYVLKTFSLVYIDDLTYVSVDTLKESFDYLMNNASSPTCEEQYFIEKGELIHTEMQGGTSSRFGFTAFVLISIMDYKDAAEKAGDFVSVNNAKNTIAGASQWIRNHKTELLASNRPYQMAISAYALARAEEGPDPTAIQLLEKIETLLENQGIMVPPKESGDCMAKPGSGVPMYCKQDSDCNSGDTSKGFYYQEMQCCKVPCEGVKVCSPKPYDSPYMQSGPTEVELNGYALMAYLQLYQKTGASSTKDVYMKKAEAKKDWLLSMRKGDGFFISTQDTAVALEALARYAIAFPNTIGADFSVRALVNDAFASGTVTVNNDNYIVNHEEKLQVSKPPSKVSLSVLKGTTGTAFVNLVALYNVNSNVSEQAYLIYITSGKADGNSVIRYTFNKNPEFTGSPGTMIVASVSLQSGFTFEKLITLTDDPTLSPEKQEYDKETNTLNMYYMNGNDNFVNVRSVDIVYKQEYDVKNRQPAVAVVRDYYKQDNNVEVMYSLNQNQNTCLSKNCPTGRAGYVSVNMFLLLIASGMLFCAQFM